MLNIKLRQISKKHPINQQAKQEAYQQLSALKQKNELLEKANEAKGMQGGKIVF